MMKLNKYSFSALALTAVFTACEPELDNPVADAYDAGSADFSNYVALGNSLTAGFADNALYRSGQEASYPNIMAEQFSLVGGGEFTQPLMNDNVGGLTLAGNPLPGFGPRLILNATATGTPTGPVPFNGTPTTEVSNVLAGPFNNMGVPGARSFHLIAPGYGDIANLALGAANPYFVRFASAAGTTVVADAAAQDPTFFSLWIGNNDILGYATSGGLNSADITDQGTFAFSISTTLDAMTANGAKGVVANIPDVTAIPFFTTVPANPIPLDAPTAAFVNGNYTQYNGGLQFAAANGLISPEEAAARTINFVPGQNFVVITDESLTDLSGFMLPNLRQTTADDLILLTTAGVLGTLADPMNPASVIGVGFPLSDSQVLTTAEQDEISVAQAGYNATLQQLATANDLAFVDARSALNQLNDSGIPFDGGVMTSAFVTGGGFSLDGVHPTARGYAYIANLMIDAVNSEYGSSVPGVNIGEYSTITLDSE